jgi:hypothetical protein
MALEYMLIFQLLSFRTAGWEDRLLILHNRRLIQDTLYFHTQSHQTQCRFRLLPSERRGLESIKGGTKRTNESPLPDGERQKKNRNGKEMMREIRIRVSKPT